MLYCNSQFNATDVSTLNQTVYPTTDGQPAQIKQPSSQKNWQLTKRNNLQLRHVVKF